jgi:hypothetical protein
MSWWNPFQTAANNGKTAEQLDAELAALDRDRAARKEAEARALEASGFYDEAEEIRDASAAWQFEHAENIDRQNAALEETVGDAFGIGWNEGAGNVRRTIGGTVTGVVGTVWKLLPWWLWLVIIAVALQYFGFLRPLVGMFTKKKRA